MSYKSKEESTRYVWDHAYLSNRVLARRLDLDEDTIQNKRYGYGTHFDETAAIAVEKLEDFVDQVFSQMNLENRPDLGKKLLDKFLEVLTEREQQYD